MFGQLHGDGLFDSTGHFARGEFAADVGIEVLFQLVEGDIEERRQPAKDADAVRLFLFGSIDPHNIEGQVVHEDAAMAIKDAASGWLDGNGLENVARRLALGRHRFDCLQDAEPAGQGHQQDKYEDPDHPKSLLGVHRATSFGTNRRRTATRKSGVKRMFHNVANTRIDTNRRGVGKGCSVTANASDG